MTGTRSALWLALATILVLLAALVQPVDHDESQYVAASSLVAHGLLPYRDFAYFQTPLQPFLLAPVVGLAGTWAWLALRIANALMASMAIGFVAAAARAAGASRSIASIAAILFAGCDILLFSAATARNDAMPAALLAAGIWLMVQVGEERRRALAIGLLLASAAAAKISYVLPAMTYGLWTLFQRDRRPISVAIGTLPVVLFLLWTFSLSPAGFLFDTLRFPTHAPAEYYQARPNKLIAATKLLDTLKFLALGAALPTLIVVVRASWRARRLGLLEVLIFAGMIAALLPTPTWRQYCLPLLPPLFVALAMTWTERRPGKTVMTVFALFATAGLIPTLVRAVDTNRTHLIAALREGRTIGRAMDRQRVVGPVATLAPQYLPATGRMVSASFAPGPFYFRSNALLTIEQEKALHLVSLARAYGAPAAILTGGESTRTAGSPMLDQEMARWAQSMGYHETVVAGTPFRLFTRPRGVQQAADNAE